MQEVWNGMSKRSGSFVPVPPPDAAPVQDLADTLGLAPGLRVEEDWGQFRCACCKRMQPRGSYLVWVPDGVERGDPAWSVTEECRRSAFNGSGSGWCLGCAKRIGETEIDPLPLLLIGVCVAVFGLGMISIFG